MKAEDIRKSFERFEGAITAVILGLAAIVGTTTRLFEVLRSPLEWSWPEFLFAGVAVFVLLVLIIRSRGRHVSILRDPDALKLDPRSPDQLIGRAEDLRKLLNTLDNRLVFLVSESGCGKSALLRAGVDHNPDFTGRFLPVYLDMSALDWEYGPLRALRDGFARALPADDPARTRLIARSGLRAYADTLDDYHQRTMRRVLLLLDQFDDYQAQPRHRDRFCPRQTMVWRQAKEIAPENAFWRVLRAGIETDALHVVVAVRDEAAPGLDSIRLLPDPPQFVLPRLERGLVRQIIERLTEPRPDRPPAINEPEHGWTALRDRMAEELEARGLVLPQQLKVALAGLRTLKRLTLSDYARAGRLAGIEAAFVADAIERAARASGLRDPDVLRLLVALVDRTRQPPDKATPRSAADLAVAEALPLPAVELALTTLAQDDVTRARGDAVGTAQAWQLDHAYLAQPILRLQRDRDQWRLLLAERARGHAEAGWRHAWRTLLSPPEQATLLWARLRGRFHYAEFRAFALLSLVRAIPALAVLSLLGGVGWGAWEYATAETIEQNLASLRSSPDPMEEEGADALGKLAAGSFVIRWRVRSDVFGSPQSANWFNAAPDHVLRALIGLDAPRLSALFGEQVTPEALRQSDPRLGTAVRNLVHAISPAALSPAAGISLRTTLIEALDNQNTAPRTNLAAVADGLRLFASSLPIGDEQVGVELARLREAVGDTTDFDQLDALSSAYATVANKLAEGDPRASTELGKLRKTIGDTTNPKQLHMLSQAYAAAAGGLAEGGPRAEVELGKLREMIRGATDSVQLEVLSRAYAAVASKLRKGDPAAGAEFVRLHEVVNSVLDSRQLVALSRAYAAVAGKLKEGDPSPTEPLGKLREAIGGTTDSAQLNVLSLVYTEVAANLSDDDPRAGMEFARLRTAIDGTTNVRQRIALLRDYAVVAGKLEEGEPQAAQALGKLREAIGASIDGDQLRALSDAYAVIAGKLKEGDPVAGMERDRLREASVQSEDSYRLAALSRAYVAVANKLTEGDPEAGTELETLRDGISHSFFISDLAPLAKAYATVAGRLKEGDPLVASELSKVSEQIARSYIPDQLSALSSAYAAVAGKLREDDPQVGAEFARLREANNGTRFVMGVDALSANYAAMASKLTEGNALVGEELNKLREAIGSAKESMRPEWLSSAYTAVASRLAMGDTRAGEELGRLREVIAATSNSDQLRALLKAYTAAAGKARLAAAPIADIAVLRASAAKLRSTQQFLSLAQAEIAAARLGSPPLNRSRVGLLIVDLMLQPLSAGEPTAFLVKEYEKILHDDPGVPEPKPSWSGDMWAFVAWARDGGLPGFDPHHVRLDFLSAAADNRRSASEATP